MVWLVKFWLRRGGSLTEKMMRSNIAVAVRFWLVASRVSEVVPCLFVAGVQLRRSLLREQVMKVVFIEVML